MISIRVLLILLPGLALAAAEGEAETALPNTTQVVFHDADPHLVGQLTLPPGPGPFPVMIYNHDSSKEFRRYPWLVKPFVTHGMAFFVPWRCGSGLSKDATRSSFPPGSGSTDARVVYLEHQELDVEDAVAWVKRQTWADPGRMAMMGNSFGGIMTVLSAEHANGVRAFIPTAPGALSWDEHPQLQTRMIEAVRHATAPMFLFQAENDKTIENTKVLYDELLAAGHPGQRQIFPATPAGGAKGTGHGFGSLHPEIWGDTVFHYLETNLGSLTDGRIP